MRFRDWNIHGDDMARTYTAYLNREQTPTLEALQAAIHALKFKLDVDEAYVPLQFSGYLPCTLDGEDAGVTIRFNPDTATEGRDTAITLQWSGDPREQVSATMLAAVLAHAFGASVDAPDGQGISAGRLVADARQQFSNLD